MFDLGIIAIEVLPAPEVVLRTKPFRRVSEIKAAVAKRFGITVAEMDSKSRERVYAIPRQIAMALAYRRLRKRGYSLPQIGRLFNRDHTTVLYACRKFGRGVR